MVRDSSIVIRTLILQTTLNNLKLSCITQRAIPLCSRLEPSSFYQVQRRQNVEANSQTNIEILVDEGLLSIDEGSLPRTIILTLMEQHRIE